MRNLFDVLTDIDKPKGQGALALMTGAEVTRVATNNESGIVEIHLDYEGSFGRSDTEEIESLIKEQYFKADNISVRLYIHQKEADDPIAAFMAEIEEQSKRAAATPASEPESNSYNGKYRRKAEPKLDESEGYGRNFSGERLKISDITTEMGACIIGGDVVMSDSRVLKNEKTLFEFVVTDYTDSIKVKIFCEKSEVKKLGALLTVGQGLLINGEAIYDSYSHEIVIQHIKGIKKVDPFKQRYRDDTEEEKRVELHCHTNMSDMDGVTDVEDLVKAAAHMGHKAIAITDHGVVYAFPHAMSAAKACKKKGQPIKILYGCEGYLINTPKDATQSEIQNAQYYHIILLAKNETGRVNLYRMVSESHLNYFHRRPRLPRWLIEECREGIIIGSACERGELFRGVVNELTDEELIDIASFYDYCEIQPVGNNAFMLREPDSRFKTEEDLRDINRKIVEIADKAGKPVAATCDVHFLNPEDEIYRRIINYGMNYPDADIQPPLYLHTTGEMLEEFSYLGEQRARNVVIEVPNQIADMCDEISPVRPDKCPPKIEGSDEELRAICTNKAHEIYGEVLPPEVESRLERELNSIISNGYAVMYIFAQRLVKKSNEDGYIVGSRGSVGSSFAATMADITEVNPLPPHYLCPACKYVDFNSPEVRAYAGKAGAIMPDKKCPKCGTQLSKLGFDIPFETFMGFHGDKEPDIDLNFSGEYQAKAHAYTDEMFGHGYTFKAGTISALSDKTAYGFTKKYFEEHNEIKRNCEIDRIALGCNGVRRSTGQHPGGIVVMPRGENIYTFTPIQHPANDVKTDIVTTHFDYHSIDKNLLKFDILGHDDPTMVKCLQDFTGLDPRTIPLDDPDTMQIFKDTSTIGVTPDDIGGTLLGTLGIPEFGTDFAMQMLIEAAPQNFADLALIAGLAHGTDVWVGNARDLILSKTVTLQTAICTRDDIMLYLIRKGLPPEKAFDIMECVRKGKVATGGISEAQWEEYCKLMKDNDVPDWYIGSCQKIKYMFPKAHAVAYVMMAWRVAYYKVHHPLAYYASYFSIRADGMNYETMCQGKDVLARKIADYRLRRDSLSDKEKIELRDMRIAEEMYARGIEFMPIDIYQANAKYCKIVDGKIMPGWISISGLGEIVAEQAAKAGKNGPYSSVDSFSSRTGMSKKLTETIKQLGILQGLPDSDQLSLFDLMDSE